MGRKLIKVVSILQIVLVIVSYFSMSIHFNKDVKVYSMLKDTDFLATFLRLSLYASPGIHLLSGLYGLVFEDKKILFVIGVIELVNCGLSLTYIGSSIYMLVLSIVSITMSILYIIGIKLTK